MAAALHGVRHPATFLGLSGRRPPFVLDMASSIVTRGKRKFAAQRGEAIAEELALDKEGRPTTDGKKAFKGVMLPFAGVKGAGLSMLMDVLSGVLTGAAFGGDVLNRSKTSTLRRIPAIWS